MKLNTLTLLIFPILISLFMMGCQGDTTTQATSDNSKTVYKYEGLTLYADNLPLSSYTLEPITDSSFNSLSDANKKLIADKLLSSMYFGIANEKLQEMIDSGTFISTIESQIQEQSNDLTSVEERLNNNGDDEEEFYFSTWPAGTAEVSKILARFYVLEDLDKSYIDYWSAYVLSSTIMFSPAYELDSSHAPNIDRVYNSLVRGFRDNCTAGYATFLHMISDDNWRRFRSPEDNGREMMEIFLQNFDDKFVPVAAQALKNWTLNRDNDTLVIGLDENTQPLELFGTTITDGFDFYRELVKSKEFMPEVTSRLVDIYFPKFSQTQKAKIIANIVASKVQTYQDILLQIVFSKEYLFNAVKPKSAEELFFSLSKKIHFKHHRGFFSYFTRTLTDMNQASMKYKLGKYTEVPLDTQSFMVYHKFMREQIFLRNNSEWSSGWVLEELIPDSLFEGINKENHKELLEKLINHLFTSTISREADEDEKAIFNKFILDNDGNFLYGFRIFRDDGQTNERRYASIIIMDYLSRLSTIYQYEKVQ